MKHKCFISYKKEDQYYRDKLVELFDSADVIDKSLNRFIEISKSICRNRKNHLTIPKNLIMNS